jgi:hypothetical protein
VFPTSSSNIYLYSKVTTSVNLYNIIVSSNIDIDGRITPCAIDLYGRIIGWNVDLYSKSVLVMLFAMPNHFLGYRF